MRYHGFTWFVLSFFRYPFISWKSDLSAELTALYQEHNSPPRPPGEMVAISHLWERTENEELNWHLDILFSLIGYSWTGTEWLTYEERGSQDWQDFQEQGLALILARMKEMKRI